MSSEKALSPLFEDSGSESSPSLLSEDDIKPKYEDTHTHKNPTNVNRSTERSTRKKRKGRFLTSVIAVVFLRESLQGRFSTGLTTTPLCPSLSLPVSGTENTHVTSSQSYLNGK